MTSSSIFFWRGFVSLVKFGYWSRFLVSIITGCGVITIFLRKGLTRSPELGSTPVWVVWLNIWRFGQVRDTRFGPNVSYKMLLNVGKCQNHRLYYFWVNKPTERWGGGGGSKITPCNTTQINVKLFNCLCDWRIRQFLKLVSKFCEDFVADFLRKSDEGEFFSFLSKHAFKTKTPFSCLRKVNSCFAVNLNFLITGFTQHLKKYSHPEVFYRKVVIKHSTHGRLFK